MARVTMGQTKEYSLPDQVKVNTDEKEKKFLEENIKTKKGTRKKTKGEKINEMLIDAQQFQNSKKFDREKTKGEEINERLKKAQKEMPGLKKGGLVKKKTSAGAAIRGKGCEIR